MERRADVNLRIKCGTAGGNVLKYLQMLFALWRIKSLGVKAKLPNCSFHDNVTEIWDNRMLKTMNERSSSIDMIQGSQTLKFVSQSS